jgi:hypothetical protein
MGKFIVPDTTTEQTTATAAPAAADAVEKTTTAAVDDLLGSDTAKVADEGATDVAADAKAETDEDDLLDGKVKTEAEKKEGETEANPDAPVYEFKVPEGFEADAELAEISKPVFAKHKLSQEQAQGLVEELGPQILARVGERQAAAWNQVKEGWAKEAKADPEIFDAAAKAVRPEVAKGRDYLGADFTAAIKLVGANNHPAVLKALARIGAALSEDTPGFGSQPKTKVTAEQRLYPNDQPKT